MDLHIVSAGSGPAILFIHAGVADSRMWRDQMDLAGYRSVAFDLRGFGRSAWVPQEYSDKEDALAVMDHLGIESATVVGCSLGGGTALDLAIDDPDRVTALVLVGAVPGGWEPEGGWEEAPFWEEAASAYKEGDLERVAEIDLAMWLVGYGRSADQVPTELKELFLDMDRAPLHTEEARSQYLKKPEKIHNDHLDEIEVPALVVVGRHDEQPIVEAAGYLADRLGGRQALVIDGAAHLPSLERPAVFNEALMGFLDSVHG